MLAPKQRLYYAETRERINVGYTLLVLFVSDLHFGHSNKAAEHAKEAAVLACLRAHEETVTQLYLLGDIFETYIEYRHLIPRGFMRFQTLLAQWTERGIPITYIVGNHDPWHRDYFREELGVNILFDPILEPLYGHNVYMAHGDGFAPKKRLYNLLKPLLRHPIPVWLYRTLLPSDSGFRLAQWTSRSFATEIRVETSVVSGLQGHARRILAETSADVVIMGHSHQAELSAWPEGQYLNTGYWNHGQTFGQLDENGLKLMRWTGTRALEMIPNEDT